MKLIVDINLAELRQCCGKHTLNLSLESLQSQPVSTLCREISDPERDINDRFYAAVALSERALQNDGHVGEFWITQLLNSMEISTRGPENNGEPLYSNQEKHTGDLAAIALRGSVFNSQVLFDDIVKRLEIGIEAMRKLKDIQITWAALETGREYGDLEKFKEEMGTNLISLDDQPQLQTQIDYAHRALIVLAGQPQDPSLLNEVVKTLSRALNDAQVDESFKLFTVCALCGRDDEAVCEAVARVVFSRDASSSLKSTVFAMMTMYGPNSEGYRGFIKQILPVLERYETRFELGGEWSRANMARKLKEQFKTAESPKYSYSQAAEARKEVGTESLRALFT
jgi:hypothetical protein